MGGDAEVPDTMRLGDLYPEQLAAGLGRQQQAGSKFKSVHLHINYQSLTTAEAASCKLAHVCSSLERVLVVDALEQPPAGDTHNFEAVITVDISKSS